MNLSTFPKGTNMTDAWNACGVPTKGRGQASRWSAAVPGQRTVLTLWIDGPHKARHLEVDDDTLIVVPRLMPAPGESATRVGRMLEWNDHLLAAAKAHHVVVLLAVQHRKAAGKFVTEQAGAAQPVGYWIATAELGKYGFVILRAHP
jgi:hypothetical protein